MPQLTKIDEDFLRIPRRFLADLNAEFGLEAVIFGGAVRDTLLGYKPSDIDILLPGNPLTIPQMREDLSKFIRTNSLFVSNAVNCRDAYEDDSNKEFFGGPILDAKFKSPMNDIRLQLISESNFISRQYLEDDLDVSASGVLIPQLSCNRISCDERANLFSEEDYMERLQNSELGVCHTISLDPFKLARRIIKFFTLRDLNPDYSAVEFLNTVIGWGSTGSEFITEAILEAANNGKSVKSDGNNVVLDPHKKKIDLFSLLGRKMNG